MYYLNTNPFGTFGESHQSTKSINMSRAKDDEFLTKEEMDKREDIEALKKYMFSSPPQRMWVDASSGEEIFNGFSKSTQPLEYYRAVLNTSLASLVGGNDRFDAVYSDPRALPYLEAMLADIEYLASQAQQEVVFVPGTSEIIIAAYEKKTASGQPSAVKQKSFSIGKPLEGRDKELLYDYLQNLPPRGRPRQPSKNLADLKPTGQSSSIIKGVSDQDLFMFLGQGVFGAILGKIFLDKPAAGAIALPAALYVYRKNKE